MTLKFSRLSFTLLLITFIAACGGGSSDSGGGSQAAVPPDPTPAPVTKIVAIGDSIGTGFGIATPWPTRLANVLGFQVVNKSVSGEQTGFGLGLIGGELDREQPTHVVIMLGTNDAIRGSVSGAISNLQEMVNIANSKNVIPIVATLPPITRSSSENSRAGQISNGIRSLSGARIADVRAALNNSDIQDGVHPSNAGQEKITSVIAAQF